MRISPRERARAITSLHADLAHDGAPCLRAREPCVLLAIGAALVTMHYHGRFWVFRDVRGPGWVESGRLDATPAQIELWSHGWQAVAALVLFVAVPALVFRLCGGRWGELGLGLPRATRPGEGRRAGVVLRPWGLALGGVVVALPALLWLAGDPAVRVVYPLYRVDVHGAAGWWPYLGLTVVWAAAVEVMLRGVLVLGLRSALGGAAVFVAAIPDAMLYFEFPMTIALVSVPGALFLGWLTLHAESVWPAVLAHGAASVALDMACARTAM